MFARLTLLATFAAVLALAGASTGAARAAAPPDAELLGQYEPLMQFDPLERFLPTKVESFITDADLEQQIDGVWTVVRKNAPPGDLPGVGSGTWRLDQDSCTPAAPLGGLDCYSAAASTGRGGPVVYGRVVREGGQTVVQYWFFYYADLYSYSYPPSDFIWQAHEGDWENVDVVLATDGDPSFVGYSQHCAGQRRAWADTPRVDGTHPIVHVAIGSHANYFTAGTHPINVSCVPPAAVGVLQRNGLPLPVDYAFAGPVAGPPGSGGAVMPVHEIGEDAPAWVGFPGTWGEAQDFHAPSPIGTVSFGSSPVGPAFHAEWSDPLGTLAGWPEG